MPRQMPWTRTLNAKTLGMILALAFLSGVLVVGNLLAFDSLLAADNRVSQAGKGMQASYEILFMSHRIAGETGDARARTAGEIRTIIREARERLRSLRYGDSSLGVLPPTDPGHIANLQRREERWNRSIEPLVERVLAAPTREAAQADLATLEPLLRANGEDAEQAIGLVMGLSDALGKRLRLLQGVFAVLVIFVLLAVFVTARGISVRTRSLAGVAERIAGGRLEMEAPVRGSDEIGALGEAFNTMTGNLRQTIEAEREGRARLERLLAAVTETVTSLASATSEILAGTTQQAAGAQEQASSVQETVSTVDEVVQTSEQAAGRARAVQESSQRAAEVGKAGRRAVEETVAAMGSVKGHSESIAGSILSLAEQAQAIGEITAAVTDIAEQTNLLALNAAIEASRAGEHGRGFSVVASEVKALADQSKKATGQVRQILGEIQKATNAAVMAAEEGTKGVNAAIRVASQAGETIRTLSDAISEAAQAASQIAASAGQQATGMAQIHQAMKAVSQVTSQNMASTRQAERAAQDLNAMSAKLTGLLGAFRR